MSPPTPESVRRALADAMPTSFWLDSTAAPPCAEPLSGGTSCDLAVVGAGYTGVWTALLAKQDEPARDVLLIEGRTTGWAASGRSGGFCASSLTHGLANGIDRFPDEMAALDRLGRENLDAIEGAIVRYGIDCSFERTGELNVATAPHQLDWLRDEAATAREFGHDASRARPRRRTGGPARTVVAHAGSPGHGVRLLAFEKLDRRSPRRRRIAHQGGIRSRRANPDRREVTCASSQL